VMLGQDAIPGLPDTLQMPKVFARDFCSKFRPSCARRSSGALEDHVVDGNAIPLATRSFLEKFPGDSHSQPTTAEGAAEGRLDARRALNA